MEDEDDADYAARCASSSLNRMHWLAAHGCTFSFDISAATAKRRKLAPECGPQYAENAAGSMDSRRLGSDRHGACSAADSTAGESPEQSGRVERRADRLLVERDPFAGLASERPARAFAALTFLPNVMSILHGRGEILNHVRGRRQASIYCAHRCETWAIGP